MVKSKKKKNKIIYNNLEIEPIGERPFKSDKETMITLPDGKIMAKNSKTKKKWLIGYWKYAK